MEATKKVAGRYVLLEQLGTGGMGSVWRATDEVLKRTIAIKEVHVPPAVAGTDGNDIGERVLREARAAARLSHPSATTVYDVFQEGDLTFIAMELVDAPTLGDIVKENGPLEPDEVARIGLSLLDALDAAHSVGMVHRDVKPDNVMVTDNGSVKLTDFGIASVKGDPRLTMSGVILGSPSYMAPEQANGHAAGREADLWSLGATMFFAVEGKAPFAKDNAVATLASVVRDPVPELQRAGSLGPVIRSLLEKDPAKRPASEILRRDLESVAHGGHTAAIATEVVERPQTTRVLPATPPSRPVPTRSKPRRNRSMYLVAALFALGLLGVIAFALAQGRDDETPKSATDGQENSQGNSGQGGDGEDAAGSDDAPVTEGWADYSIADTGYVVSYPEGWEIAEDGTQVTFSDPASSTSFLVEYTTEPGDDAVAAWEAQAETFAAEHGNYQEITIEETTVEGFDTAAIWEFTYDAEGVTLHAIDIGMANDDIGFAHFFQTTEEEWDSNQELLQQFRDSFRAA
jgi:eukaryotic-like serine/threonine-protein kinase